MADGAASWRDVAFVNSPIHPDVLRLNFVLDGDLVVHGDSPGNGNGGASALFINTTSSPRDFFGDPVNGPGLGTYLRPDMVSGGSSAALGADNGAGPGYPPQVVFDASGWDSYTFDGSHFTGYFHIDSPYDADLSGYGWGVRLDAVASVLGASAETNALHTLGLSTITTVDGTPVDVTFDSGLRLGASAVPEPSSVVMLGLGAIGLVGAMARRKS